jgi:hypothetical protein
MKININGNLVEVDNEVLSKAIEEKTESIEVTSNLKIRTAEDEERFVANIKTESNGALIEIGRKEMLKGLGIDPNGAHKTDESAISAINSFMEDKVATALTDAKVAPDAKVQELTADKLALTNNLNALQTDFDTFKTGVSNEKLEAKRINTISGFIPDNTLNSKDNTMTILNSRLKTAYNDEGVLHGIDDNGNPMKNGQTMDLLPMKDVVQQFFDSNPDLLKTASGGGGGGDSGHQGGKQTLAEFTEEMKGADKYPNSPEFVEEMTVRVAAGTLAV